MKVRHRGGFVPYKFENPYKVGDLQRSRNFFRQMQPASVRRIASSPSIGAPVRLFQSCRCSSASARLIRIFVRSFQQCPLVLRKQSASVTQTIASNLSKPRRTESTM